MTTLRATATCARHVARALLVLTSASILVVSALVSCNGDPSAPRGTAPPDVVSVEVVP